MLKSNIDLHNIDDNTIEPQIEPIIEEDEKKSEETLKEEDSEVSEQSVKLEYPERKLHGSEVSVRLSLLGKTADGDGYTYLKAKCTGMKLTDISAICAFKHLLYVDVSDNFLTLDSLQVITTLPYLVLIHADKNLLQSAALKPMKYMQVMILNNNEITSVNDVYQPELCTLEAGYNKIEKIEFNKRMETIKVLDFRYNFISDLSDLDFVNMDSLYLAGNKIRSLEGIGKLVNLRILHVRDNPIKLLNGFEPDMKKLQYVNLRDCKVMTHKQIKKLRVLESLDTIILRGCPIMGAIDDDAEVEEDGELRVEILATLPRLKRINKGIVTAEERTEANNLLKEWIEEEEVNEEESEGEEELTSEEKSLNMP
ncbi:leucine-rich repeat-containing protein 23-like [Aricia agestis]|uniref:leucine-rich repeat-containing protein 23-like n=1 Tax=Aricia agestis TaxID=91739 RepID=UPI001C204E33|nr:leucine-rich repeat-containing protein 23-like [Aricia agestis]